MLFPTHGVQRRMISVDNFLYFWIIIIFCFVVAKCDLMHDVETIFHLSYVLTASGNLFRNMSDARETENCSFMGITHISEKISRNCSFTGITHISEKISRCC